MKQETVNRICEIWDDNVDDYSHYTLLNIIKDMLGFEDISPVIKGLAKGGRIKERTDD